MLQNEPSCFSKQFGKMEFCFHKHSLWKVGKYFFLKRGGWMTWKSSFPQTHLISEHLLLALASLNICNVAKSWENLRHWRTLSSSLCKHSPSWYQPCIDTTGNICILHWPAGLQGLPIVLLFVFQENFRIEDSKCLILLMAFSLWLNSNKDVNVHSFFPS